MGSSLFRITDYVIGQYYVFEAVENYFRGTSQISRINMPIMTDSTAISQALISGQISTATTSIPPETINEFEAAGNLDILSGRGFSPTFLQFNTENEILRDPAFRRALGFALDIPEMIDAVMLGFGIVGLPGFYTDDMPQARVDLQYTYDPALASSILEELGYSEQNSDGIRLMNGEPISFDILVQSGNIARLRAAELISAYLKDIGIQVNVVSMESDTLDTLVWPDFDVSLGRDFDMAMWGWSAPVQLNPASIVRLGMSDHTIGDLNIGGLSCPIFDELSRAYLSTSNATERDEISLELQERIAYLAPFINLWYDNLNFAVNTSHYGDWQFQTGIGVINRFSFLPYWVKS